MPTASHQVLPMCCSAFFRPSEAFNALDAWVVGDLLDRATPERPARVWIPACATGEEAYSIAMLLIEHCQAGGRRPDVRIFATDTDANSIEVARAGVYAEADMIGVSPQRLQKFFQRHGNGRWRVSTALRDSVVFATHDIDRDPPLSRLDFVSCQNVMLQPAPDRLAKLYSLLHFALNEGGCLLVGAGENIAPSADLFQPIGAVGCVYRRLSVARLGELDFAAMLRDSADAIVVTDFGGRIVAWNRGAQRLYGYTQAEALKLNVRDLMAGDRLDSTLEVMRRVARGETVAAFDTQRRTRDGRIVDVSATVALLFDVAGNPTSLAATERDITARRRAEDETRMLNARLEQRVAERATELQHSEDQIRAILDATADAVVTIDMLGRIAAFNRAAERIFGYTASEVIGENATMLIPLHERFGRYGYKATAARSYASRLIGRSHEISGRRKDGSLFPIQLSVNSVEGRGLYVGVARDMSEHKALQKEIIDVAMLEQRRIGQELHDGTQQELTGLGLLALSLAESLSRGGSTTASQLAARVARGIEQCNQRVRSLARGMVPVPIDREGLMTALAELARQTTEIHGLPCSFECPTPVEIDNDNEATHLYRIAQEAVSNATRHAKASAIWIRLEQVDGRLILEVQDNGNGLQPAGIPGKGVGLRLMEHRCAMIGGNFAIDPRTEGGTCIACSVSRAQER